MKIDPKKVRQSKDKLKPRPCGPKLVEDLRVGDEIGTVFVEDDYGRKAVIKTRKIESIEECTGQWRTHVHINKSSCYDIRQHVQVPL